LQHKIKHARSEIRYGHQVFDPVNNQVHIYVTDTEKGELVKHGELVLLNSFGKSVKIPFSFSYTNP
jgi:hypothetical protein